MTKDSSLTLAREYRLETWADGLSEDQFLFCYYALMLGDFFAKVAEKGGWSDEVVRQWRDDDWFDTARKKFEEWSLRKAVEASVKHARIQAAADAGLAVDILKGRGHLSSSKLKPPPAIDKSRKVDLKEQFKKYHAELERINQEIDNG